MKIPPIDYDIHIEVRKEKLMPQLLKLSLEKQRAILLRSTYYQSGPGLLNTVYMGSMATAGLCVTLGGQYGKDSVTKLIKAADAIGVRNGLRAAYHTVEYMLANPRFKCPCCGNITTEDLTQLLTTNEEEIK